MNAMEEIMKSIVDYFLRKPQCPRNTRCHAFSVTCQHNTDNATANGGLARQTIVKSTAQVRKCRDTQLVVTKQSIDFIYSLRCDDYNAGWLHWCLINVHVGSYCAHDIWRSKKITMTICTLCWSYAMQTMQLRLCKIIDCFLLHLSFCSKKFCFSRFSTHACLGVVCLSFFFISCSSLPNVIWNKDLSSCSNRNGNNERAVL